ncbi:hypothetical protein XA68_13696 [Ophiocordyceps unilateralis]|uniref:Hydrophobin n=1 Tax=Ophiocordyceps unilateralis TaxID=268505 RepID=A0A2A9PC23_OPHUN|nr:hypothetical protein XA68_13696 [Ophiocordyceps unilateralis]
MHYITALALFAAGSLAATYNKGNPVINSKCSAVHLTQPSNPIFPFANLLGSVIGPQLRGLLGSNTVDEIDAVADQLCISAQQAPADGLGVCQQTFGAVRDFVDAKTPLAQSKQFGCLLNLICVAHSGPQNTGTCNQLLGGADCIANRIIADPDPECTS